VIATLLSNVVGALVWRWKDDRKTEAQQKRRRAALAAAVQKAVVLP
jgi:hypothetical protein